MKKEDLRTGMIVETRNGNEYIVMLNCGLFIKDRLCNVKNVSFLRLNNYNSELLRVDDTNYDIMKVADCSPTENLYNLANNIDIDYTWDREEVCEMTLEEISKELGYEVKVVK